jgi:hypothetical protein
MSESGRCAGCGAEALPEVSSNGLCPTCLLKLGLSDHTPALPPQGRDLSRPRRLHWLTGKRAAGECWDAYEAVEGLRGFGGTRGRTPCSAPLPVDLPNSLGAGRRSGCPRAPWSVGTDAPPSPPSRRQRHPTRGAAGAVGSSDVMPRSPAMTPTREPLGSLLPSSRRPDRSHHIAETRWEVRGDQDENQAGVLWAPQVFHAVPCQRGGCV